MTTELSFWIFFILFIALMMALDLGVFHRKSHIVTFKESLAWTIVWMGLAMTFNVIIYLWKGPDKAIEFALITVLTILIISIFASLIAKPAIKKLT